MDDIKSFVNPNHESTTRMFGYALTHGDADAWLGAVNVFRVRLTESELASAGFAILRAMNRDNAALTAEAVLGISDTPPPPFLSAMDSAVHWADWAEMNYVKACVMAGYNKMPKPDRAAFLEFVQGSIAA